MSTERYAPPKVATLTGLLGNQGDIVNLVGTGDYLCSATTCTSASDWKQITSGGSSGAPTDATYITQTANSTLSAEQALSALSTGLMKVTTATGVISSEVFPGNTKVLFDNAGSVGGNAAFIFNATALAVPAAPTLAKVGAGTGTTWGYTVVAKTLVGGSEPSTEATISGNATLDGSHSITVTPPSCGTRVTGYDVYRTTAGGTPSTTGLIAQDVACGVPLSDTGLPYLYPVSAPSTSDFSTGIGSSTPLVVTNYGSFGSLASEVWNDNQPFAGQPGILSIAERSSLLPGPYGLSVNVVVDADNYASNGFFRDINHDVSDFGQHPNLLVVTYDGQSGTGYAVNNLIAVQASHFLTRVGSIATSLTGVQDYSYVNLGSCATYYGFYEYVPQGSGVITDLFAFYSQDLTARATNGYAFWYDSPGVFRIKSDGVMAYYNPSFTKYVPGAANYERIVQQWNTNVAEIGTEVGAGGGNVLRDLRLIGANIQLSANTIVATGKAIRTDATTAHTALFQAYDVDGTAYKTFATLTNGNTPDFTIAPPSGGTVNIQGVYKSNDGTSGATAGPFTAITSITVKDGIVTALTGT